MNRQDKDLTRNHFGSKVRSSWDALGSLPPQLAVPLRDAQKKASFYIINNNIFFFTIEKYITKLQ